MDNIKCFSLEYVWIITNIFFFFLYEQLLMLNHSDYSTDALVER